MQTYTYIHTYMVAYLCGSIYMLIHVIDIASSHRGQHELCGWTPLGLGIKVQGSSCGEVRPRALFAFQKSYSSVREGGGASRGRGGWDHRH